jgi:protein-S-isoprenylcysteine O-methyltransferase Ste14
MRATGAVVGSALFFIIAPFMVGFVVPWWIAGWRIGNTIWLAGGVFLVLAGLVPLIESFARFAVVGLGTPAPVAPTKHLVVSGFYRYVRNPMYLGVILIIVGNGLILGNPAVFAYAALIALGFALFVLGYEEPTLKRQFGAEYERFCRHVPRWIPRLTPWSGK